MNIQKSASEFVLADIEELVAGKCTENFTIEFKSTLPGKGAVANPWDQGLDKLDDKAREEIVSQIVAFANSMGGHLFLGIQEDGAGQGIATSIIPIQRAAELLDRLLRSASSTIEPMVYGLEGKCIPCGEEGYGVLVFSVPRSQSSPHRFTVLGKSYVRDGTQVREMSMEEIQRASIRTYRRSLEGFWTGKFVLGSVEVGVVVVLESGKIYGGDGNFYYTGWYEENGEGKLEATAVITHFHGPNTTIFGRPAKQYSVSIKGQLANEVIDAKFSLIDNPSVFLPMKLLRRKSLT